MMFERHRQRVDELLASGETHVATAFRRIRQGAQRTETRFDGLAGCLRTPRGGSAKQIVVAMDEGRLKMRWMSPQEYARLQGVKELPSIPASKNELLLAFGDAVCVPVIQWIDQNLLTPLFESACPKGRNTRARQSDTRAAP
jgi:DNA (cytosine-5)-methyltransferase 1